MKKRLVLAAAALAVLGLLGGGLAVAGGREEEVKTQLKDKNVEFFSFQVKGQITTKGGNRKARKRCLKQRTVVVKAPIIAAGARARWRSRKNREIHNEDIQEQGPLRGLGSRGQGIRLWCLQVQREGRNGQAQRLHLRL